MPNLHFEGGGEVFPRVVQLVAEHLHGEPLHDARPGHHELLVQADPALGERLQLRPQFSVAPAIPLGNLQKESTRALLELLQTRTLCSCPLTI